MGFQAKSYRKFIATAATATLVATAVTPAFAAGFADVSDRYKEAVDYLVKNDVTQGMTETNFGVQEQIKRVDAAVMLAKLLKLNTETAPDAGFVDVPKRATGAVNALKAKGIINGKTETTFGAEDTLTRGEMAIIIARAYELKDKADISKFTDVSDRYADSVAKLVAAGITEGKTATQFGTTAPITRGEFAIFAFRAETPAVKEAKVESVTAIDAKTIEVKFNKAVDAKTLVKDEKDVITVVAGEGAADFEGVTQTLSEDGKTLTLTATKIFKGDYTVKVPFEIIKDVNGQFVSPINAKVTVNDKAAPVLTAATSTIKDTKDGLKKITLSFDEEVVSIDTVKIDGVNYSATVNGKEATVVVDLDATKTYDVTVVNATDAAGNVKDMQEATVSVTVDNVAPSILSVVPAGENKVTVTVDKELAADTLTVTGKVGTFSANVVTKAEVNPKNKKEYTVTLDNSYLFKNGDSDKVTLTVAKEALVDTLGNKNASEISTDVVVSKDATAPEVVKVATSTTDGKVTSFSVTYNEEVAAPTLAKAAVVNSKGEILPAGSVVADVKVSAEDAKTVVFTLVNGLATDKYSFDLAEGFVVDKALAPNKSAKYAFNVDVTEAGKPVETSFTIKDATVAANVITVDFGEKVKATGTGSALNPSAYQLNGVALPADTNIAFAKNVDDSIDQTKVVITLPSGFVKANDAKAIFRVNAIQTLDNKVSNQFSKVLAVSDNTAPEVKSIVATDLTKLTVTYTEAIKLTDAATVADIQDEIKLVDSKGAAIAFTAAEIAEGGKLVLTVADATKVSSLTTVEVDAAEQDILDLNDVAQKAGVTVSK
ncbi:hypothetical protein CEW92_01160 [Bacillaceae bacterium SAS-127]|nr:hypothetical protein CEW92_01160 [Bacillaceae bacterium SAS-127]